MNQDDVLRILDAFEAFHQGSIPPYGATDLEQCQADADMIQERYQELSRTVSFAEAARTAKAEFMLSVAESTNEATNLALTAAKVALSGAVTSHSQGCGVYLKRECDCWLADRKEALARIGKL